MRKHQNHKPRRKVSTTNDHLTKLLLGVAAGGLVGAGAAFFLASRQEETFQDNLADAYKSVRSKAQNYAKKGINSVSDYAETIKDKANDFLESSYENSGSTTTILLGALGGGILGIATILLLSPETGKEIRDDLAEAYEKTTDLASHLSKTGKNAAENLSSIDWVDLAKTVLQTVTNNIQSEDVRHGVEEEFEEVGARTNIPEILKFATMGLHLWQNVKGRR